MLKQTNAIVNTILCMTSTSNNNNYIVVICNGKATDNDENTDKYTNKTNKQKAKKKNKFFTRSAFNNVLNKCTKIKFLSNYFFFIFHLHRFPSFFVAHFTLPIIHLYQCKFLYLVYVFNKYKCEFPFQFRFFLLVYEWYIYY